MNENYFIRQGWECPKCGRVYSPDTAMCLYCQNMENPYWTGNVINPCKSYEYGEKYIITEKN